MNTGKKIIGAAQGLLANGGLGAVSFDAIARELGIAKQSVLYWFPSKSDLLAAMFVEWLSAEAKQAEESLLSAETPNEAIDVFVRSITSFHVGNLDRFRMMYLAPQTLKAGMQVARNDDVLDKIHATTAQLYGALAARLEGSPDQARQTAFAIHSACLGLVLMLALAEGIGDPLAHSESDLVMALISKLSS
ncbi:TetR/AcrR family transcriptional regulator [Sulfitobacter mediterraneus]|jgi:AcrR family transcriptional regulator|uniref:TetR family transcriptional regulator n=1 Tax=Sulfitobacter mediterraneus TaxID=83219 RepID=A0A2T6BZ44_9RHOB|nr:TetR/AcrR family transcriptional regulator [Sulfitobacter mediterraneus]KIN75645.1 Transcriptional regulator, TetR family [Sulfitobacter mediterraneus KCTC 32188]PTX61338.1 TetR family transcriptional regulator [Sulfitobacter mediterraneus]